MMEAFDDVELWTKPEGYINAHHPKFANPVEIPLKLATDASLASFGCTVCDFDVEDVMVETWPQTGRRSIIAGTGRGGGILTEEFQVYWDGDLARVEEIPPDLTEQLVAGRLAAGVSPSSRTHVLVRDFTCHPDGGQVFYPQTPEPYVQVFGPPGDDVKPSDMVAFYFDGSFGFQIKANIWHQFPFPENQKLAFNNKQRAVFACVMVDFVKEFKTYLKVPLKQS